MDLGLKDKVALVTGASRGIGLAIARSLGKEGSRLALCARGEEALEESAAVLRNEGLDVTTWALDASTSEGAETLVSEVTGRLGGIDVFVGNVGGNRRGRFEDTSDEDWEAVLDANLRGHIRCARQVVPVMRERSGGAITFIASIFGREAGGPGLSIYNTTKSALISLAKIMALELAQDGIRVNTVAPGSIRFPGGSWDRRCIQDPEGMKQFIADNIPLGRFGTAEEIGDVVAFLSSERASWVSGASLNVDGVQSRSLI